MNAWILPLALLVIVVALLRDAKRAAPGYFATKGYITLSILEPGVSNTIVTLKVEGKGLFEEAHTGQIGWHRVGEVDLAQMTISYKGKEWKITGWTVWPFKLPLSGKPLSGNAQLVIGVPV